MRRKRANLRGRPVKLASKHLIAFRPLASRLHCIPFSIRAGIHIYFCKFIYFGVNALFGFGW